MKMKIEIDRAVLQQALDAQQKPIGWIAAQALADLQKPDLNWMPVWNRETGDSLVAVYSAPQPAQQEPLTDANKQFNAAIDFAIEQGREAALFLSNWREGDTAEWPEFDAYLAAHSIK